MAAKHALLLLLLLFLFLLTVKSDFDYLSIYLPFSGSWTGEMPNQIKVFLQVLYLHGEKGKLVFQKKRQRQDTRCDTIKVANTGKTNVQGKHSPGCSSNATILRVWKSEIAE